MSNLTTPVMAYNCAQNLIDENYPQAIFYGATTIFSNHVYGSIACKSVINTQEKAHYNKLLTIYGPSFT